jgi:choline-glycine betaine transporter
LNRAGFENVENGDSFRVPQAKQSEESASLSWINVVERTFIFDTGLLPAVRCIVMSHSAVVLHNDVIHISKICMTLSSKMLTVLFRLATKVTEIVPNISPNAVGQKTCQSNNMGKVIHPG